MTTTPLFSTPPPICIIEDKVLQNGNNAVVEHGFTYWLKQLKIIDQAVQSRIVTTLVENGVPKVVARLVLEYTEKSDFYDIDFSKNLTSFFNLVFAQIQNFCSYQLTIGDHIIIFELEKFRKRNHLAIEMLCPKETVVECCAITKTNGVKVDRHKVRTTWGECTKACPRPPAGYTQWQNYIDSKKNWECINSL